MPTKSKPVVPGASAALWLLLAINLFNFIDRYVLASVLPKIETDFHASGFQAGALQTAFLVSYMLFAPAFGWMGDRFGRWRIIGLAVIAWSLASGASGLATGIGMMLITRMFVGIGEAAYGPIAPTVIADLYPVERRGRMMAFFYAAIPVGSALGYVLGGLVLKAGHSWHWASFLNWHWAFFLVLPPGIVLGLICFLMREPARGAVDPEGIVQVDVPKKIRFAAYRILFKTPSYVFNTAGMTAMTFALGGIAIWMPKYIVWRSAVAGSLNMADQQAVDAALAGANSMFGPIIVVAGLFGTVLGGLAGDWLRPRYSGAYFLVSGAAMVLAFPLFLALPVTPFPAAWVLIFITSVCLFFNTGPTNTILANVTHPAMRATAYALNIFVIHLLGDAISPPLIGGINDLAGGNMDAGFLAISITILISGLFWLFGARYLARDTELAPTRLDVEKNKPST
ncbi:MAG TPA: MFS transporter [Pirellulales bacterium]|jgi:MFS family permease|nr:MFS transporter [Pirellulales bacterium]